MPDNRKPLIYGVFPVCRNYTVRAYLRHHSPSERRGCKNGVFHAGSLRRWVHPPTLHGRSRTKRPRPWVVSWSRSCKTVKKAGQKAQASCPALFDPFRPFPHVGHGVGQMVDPHRDPHQKIKICNKKASKTEVFKAFCHVLIKKMHPKILAAQRFPGFMTFLFAFFTFSVTQSEPPSCQ